MTNEIKIYSVTWRVRSIRLQLTLILSKIMLVGFSIIASNSNNDKKSQHALFLIYCFYFLTQSFRVDYIEKALLNPSPTMAVLLRGSTRGQRQKEVPIFIYLLKSRGKRKSFLISIVKYIFCLFLNADLVSLQECFCFVLFLFCKCVKLASSLNFQVHSILCALLVSFKKCIHFCQKRRGARGHSSRQRKDGAPLL